MLEYVEHQGHPTEDPFAKKGFIDKLEKYLLPKYLDGEMITAFDTITMVFTKHQDLGIRFKPIFKLVSVNGIRNDDGRITRVDVSKYKTRFKILNSEKMRADGFN